MACGGWIFWYNGGMRKFDPGDVVVMKSGGPKMTVERYAEQKDYSVTPPAMRPMCRCVYFIGECHTPCYIELDDVLLKIVKEA